MKFHIGTTRAFHLFHLGRELARLGHHVRISGYIPARRARYYRYGDAEYNSLFLRTFPQSAFALQRAWQETSKNATERLFESTDRLTSKLILDDKELDVYVGLSAMAVSSFSAAKSMGAIAVCDRGAAHVLEQRDALQRGGGQQLSDTYVKRELASYAGADAIVVPSSYARDSFQRFAGKQSPLFVNVLGVDPLRFRANGKEAYRRLAKSLRVVFVGGWTKQKGCDLLVQYVANEPKVELTHCGVVPNGECKTHPRIRHLGHIDNHRLSQLLQEHDVLVLPSRQDGFGMVLLEALASGIPVVASKNTGAPDIRSIHPISEAVTLMRDFSIDGLQRALLECISASSRYSRRDIAEQTIDTFSWEAYAKRYVEVCGHLKGDARAVRAS